MLDETIPFRIRQIIASNDATNNFLALTLLRSQLGFNFIKAFEQLQIVDQQDFSIWGVSQYQVSILEYDVLFLAEHQWDDLSQAPYLSIERKVKQQETTLEAYQKTFTIPFFESENERDIYEALIDLPNLGEGLEKLFF